MFYLPMISYCQSAVYQYHYFIGFKSSYNLNKLCIDIFEKFTMYDNQIPVRQGYNPNFPLCTFIGCSAVIRQSRVAKHLFFLQSLQSNIKQLNDFAPLESQKQAKRVINTYPVISKSCNFQLSTQKITHKSLNLPRKLRRSSPSFWFLV